MAHLVPTKVFLMVSPGIAMLFAYLCTGANPSLSKGFLSPFVHRRKEISAYLCTGGEKWPTQCQPRSLYKA